MRRFLLPAAMVLCLSAAAASADTTRLLGRDTATTSDVSVTTLGGKLNVNDVSFSTNVNVTAGATALTNPGRTVVTTCTVAGNVVIVHKDTTTVTVAASVGTSYWPEAAVQIATSGTTATCTYWIES